MRFISLLIFSASWCFAISTATTDQANLLDFELFNIDDLSQLPDGHSIGQNWPNGSTTLFFPDLEQAFTFVPTKPPTASVRTRGTGSDGAGSFDCWTFQPELDHGGVDQAIRSLRELAAPSDEGFLIGRYRSQLYYYDTPYRGYNVNGVYVYYCRNAQGSGLYTISMVDIDFSTAHMDADCGAYQPGFWQWGNSDTLFGKTLSGTHVCAGSDQ